TAQVLQTSTIEQTWQTLFTMGAAVGSLSSSQVLSAVDTGAWTSTGNHTPGVENYIAGQTTTNQFHDFFVFNLAGVTQTIGAAQLVAFNPFNGYSSSQPSDTLTLFDVSTPIINLTGFGTGQTGIYNDLGSGTSYGSTTVSALSNGQPVSVS